MKYLLFLVCIFALGEVVSGIQDEFVRSAIGQLREKIQEYLEKIRVTKQEIEKSAGEARDVAKKHLKELEEKLAATTRQLIQLLLGNTDNIAAPITFAPEVTVAN